MLIPDFSLQKLIPQYPDAGGAFQAFVSDLMKRELPGLDEFTALGKDGGIDFCQNNGNRLLVGECKFMEGGNLDTALREWKKVEEKLREHLASPAGPTKGQSQYQPWYNHNPAIGAYYFCINVNLTNLNQVTILEGAISGDFVKLSNDFPHLHHLRTMQVIAIHWGRLKERLEAYPFVYFAWFRDSNIAGLEQLDTPSQLRGFRAYLGNDKLPYYSIEKHKTIIPPDAASAVPPSESDLLDFLDTGHKPGVIITGSGGLGKSRLSLQLARLAKGRDWPVFRVRRINNDTIERLARGIGTASPALLIFDYLETHDDFAQIVEDLVQINDMSGCRLRFVASCRLSYYKSAIKQRVNHLEVNLAGENTWLEGYRHAAVRHILTTTGIEADADHLRICKGISVLAVFMAYLRERGREDELHELIRIEDFGKWVVKRLDTAFDLSAGRDLAILVALFPLPMESIDRLDRERFDRLYAILAEDGWIEERDWDELHDGPVWGTVHDVLADGVMLAHLDQVARSSERFVTDLLRTAANMGLLRSALTSLQRIVFETPLTHVKWLDIFSARMAENPAPWKEARETLLQFAGLELQQRINLLNRSPEIWEGAEGNVLVQNALGWVARCVTRDEASLASEEEMILREWLTKAAGQLTTSNYLLTWGLRLYPDLLKEHALNWFRFHSSQFQTHYLLVAWLEKDLPVTTVAEWVMRWSTRNANIPHFSFVASAWLDAGGARELIEIHIRSWLEVEENRLSDSVTFVYTSWLAATKDGDFVRDDVRTWLDVEVNRLSESASHVYRSWLAATKDGDFVRDDVRAWLDVEANRLSKAALSVYKNWIDVTREGEFVRNDVRAWLEVKANCLSESAHFLLTSWLDATKDGEFVQQTIIDWLGQFAEYPEADFVCNAWLEANGAPAVVKVPAIRWLRIYHEKEEAVFITKFLAKQRKLPVQAILDILTWCRIYSSNPDALWRLTAVAHHAICDATANDFHHTSKTIIEIYLTRQNIDETAAGQISAVICFLIRVASHRPALDNSVDDLFVCWLRHPDSYGKRKTLFSIIQRRGYLQRVAELLKGQKLNMTTDRDALTRFLQWVNLWPQEKKTDLCHLVDYLRRKFPDPTLWAIVTF